MQRQNSEGIKKLLFISYDFPPARTSGIYRPTKFIKHLGHWGWHPTVLTAKNPFVSDYDESLLADIPPDTQIFRTPSPDILTLDKYVYRLIFGKPDTAENSTTIRPTSQQNSAGTAANRPSWLKRFLFRPLRSFIEHWVCIPDTKFLWFPFALIKSLNIIAQEKPDIILTTSAPHTVQLIGLALAWITGIPWIADFRDNWVLGYRQNYHDQRRADIDEWLMRRIVQHADQVIAMSDGNAEDIRTHFSPTAERKVWGIPNGFDEDDFRNLPERSTASAADQCVLLHMGTVYGTSYGQFFHALAGLLSERVAIRGKLRVDFIGYPTPNCRRLVDELGLEDTVQFLGFRSHPEALQAMIDANVLLLFLGGEKILNQQYPGKVFEYLRTKHMILTLGAQGEIVDTVLASGCGMTARYDDTGAITDALGQLYDRWQSGELETTPNEDVINQFEYRNLTERLVRVLETARKSGA